MKVIFYIQFLLLTLIVLVNALPQSLPFPISPIPATIALALLAMVHLYIKLKPHPVLSENTSGNVTVQIHQEESPEQIFDIDSCKSLMDIFQQAKETAHDVDNLEQLSLEFDTYRQCYLWIQNMEKTYGRPWRETIQGAEMPISPEIYPQIHRMMAEISLHTIDFCRYRMGYVNLTPLMKVNPTMMLLEKDAKVAGAKPLNDDPFETDREARVLFSLLKHDGVSLQNATIHGYYVPKELEDEKI